MKPTMKMICQIIGIIAAVAALVCAIVGIIEYINYKRKPYTEFPPEYDDYADWDVE